MPSDQSEPQIGRELIEFLEEKEAEYQSKYRDCESGDSREAGVYLGRLHAYRHVLYKVSGIDDD